MGRGRGEGRNVAVLDVGCLQSGSCLEGQHSFYAQLLLLQLNLGNLKVNDLLKNHAEYDRTRVKISRVQYWPVFLVGHRVINLQTGQD